MPFHFCISLTSSPEAEDNEPGIQSIEYQNDGLWFLSVLGNLDAYLQKLGLVVCFIGMSLLHTSLHQVRNCTILE
jgi:hypothetical protein